MTAREILNRKLSLIVAVYTAGLTVMLGGVVLFNSLMMVATAFGALVISSAVGYHWFRCPSCQQSILHFTLTEAKSWLTGRTVQCPFCETELEAGLARSAEGPALPADAP